MNWNYRVIRSNGQYAIHEVYYKDENLTLADGYSADPAYPHGENSSQFLEDVCRYLDAIESPVLVEAEDGSLSKLSYPLGLKTISELLRDS